MLGMKVEIQIKDVKQFYVDQNIGINKSTPLEKNSSLFGGLRLWATRFQQIITTVLWVAS